MVEKAGKFGIFLACSRYPDCDNTKELEPAEAATEELDETCENCGRPMVVKRGRFGMFLACTGYPECKTTRKIIATKQGVARREAGPDPRREVPELRQEPRHQAGPVRRVHGVHRLSRVQVRQAEVHRRRLPEGRRRRRRAQVTARQGVLRLRELSEVRLHAVEQADSRAVPEVRAGSSSPRRSPSATAGSSSAPTRSATTCGPPSLKRRRSARRLRPINGAGGDSSRRSS